MNVGDVVKRISSVSGSSWPPSFLEELGTVVDKTSGTWPRDWDITDYMTMSEMIIGCRVDVLWQDGRLSRDISTGSLEVVIQNE